MASRTNRGSVDKTISIPDELYKLPARARTHTQRSSIRKWQILTCVNKQVSTTKGTGGDIIILEEAAYVSSGFFYETVAPLLCIGNTSFIAISTLTSEMNFYTKLISKMDQLTNLPVFKSIQISLACQACIDAEIAHECLHMQHLIPRWQDADKHRRLKIIMSDRPDLINSEMGGVAFNSVDQCFKQSLLKQMFNESIPLRIEFNTRFFVTVDPAAGGEHSDFAIVSFSYCHGIFKILGADVLQTKDPYKTFERLKEHVNAVRMGDENYSSSSVCIIVERNLGFEAEHLFRECRDSIPNSCFLCEPGVDRIGVLTTHSRKIAYVGVMNNLLRETRIFIDREGWVDCGNNKTSNMLLEQLSFFGFAFTRPENAFQKEKMAISGKSSGGKDDLCMALLIGVFFVVEDRFIER